MRPAYCTTPDLMNPAFQLLGRLDQSESEQVHENVCGALVWMVSQHGQMQVRARCTLSHAFLPSALQYRRAGQCAGTCRVRTVSSERLCIHGRFQTATAASRQPLGYSRRLLSAPA